MHEKRNANKNKHASRQVHQRERNDSINGKLEMQRMVQVKR